MDLAIHDFSYEIPDSDAKIFMSLDDIIRMEGIRKPGPGSVRSMCSRRSAGSIKSRLSMCSNTSRRSNRSRRSTCSRGSRKSNTYANTIYNANVGGYRRYKMDDGHQIIRRVTNFDSNPTILCKILKGPGQYTPKNNIKFYKGKVRQAIKTLSGIFNRQGGTGLRKVFDEEQVPYIQQHLSYRKNLPFRNVRRNPTITKVKGNGISPLKRINTPKQVSSTPLTRQSLELFNKMDRRSRTHSSTASQATSNRHSVQGSINRFTQEQIKFIQNKFAKKHTNDVRDDMNFIPTPTTTQLLISERFSMYD